MAAHNQAPYRHVDKGFSFCTVPLYYRPGRHGTVEWPDRIVIAIFPSEALHCVSDSQG